jgi:putative redox protein
MLLATMAADASNNPPHVIVRGGGAGFAQEIEIGPHRLKGDEPLAFGGTDTGPSPYDFVLAALGTCTSMTISLYAQRKGWPLDSITISLHHSKIHAVDCAECETKVGKIDRIEREIQLTGALSTEQRAKLMEIADKCPVHRTLTSEINIRTRAV